MKRLGLIGMLLALASAPAIAGEVKLSASKYNVNAIDGQAQFIEIMNKGDDPIEIRAVEVNRGNCKSWPKPVSLSKPTKLPITIGFGQKYTHVTLVTCEVIELSISTNRGGYVLSW